MGAPKFVCTGPVESLVAWLFLLSPIELAIVGCLIKIALRFILIKFGKKLQIL